MRSVVGQKDIFLSYAHVTINFARRIKVSMNSVWHPHTHITAYLHGTHHLTLFKVPPPQLLSLTARLH